MCLVVEKELLGVDLFLAADVTEVRSCLMFTVCLVIMGGKAY